VGTGRHTALVSDTTTVLASPGPGPHCWCFGSTGITSYPASCDVGARFRR